MLAAMKTLISCLCLAAAALILAADNTPPMPEGAQVGRFQLMAGTVPGLDGPAGIATKDKATTLRIDTATGRVWQLQAVPLTMPGGAMPVHTWLECHEVNGQLYRKALDGMQSR
jgi:hypothetical protein